MDTSSATSVQHIPGACGDGRCRNCAADASDRYCPACVQATALHPPTVREFIREFLGHHVAIEGSPWRTLCALLLTPGRLTTEYFAGRRARYIGPLRLYPIASLLLFTVAGLDDKGFQFGNGIVQLRVPDESGDEEHVVVGLRHPRVGSETNVPTGFAALDRAVARIEAMTPQQRTEHVNAGIRQYLPFVLIVLVPVLALLLRLLYWDRRRLYGEHPVFAFHAQTVAFIVELIAAIPIGEWFAALMSMAFVVHGAIALRRVCGGRWLPTVLREAVLLTVYGMAVGVSVAAVAIVGLALRGIARRARDHHASVPLAVSHAHRRRMSHPTRGALWIPCSSRASFRCP